MSPECAGRHGHPRDHRLAGRSRTKRAWIGRILQIDPHYGEAYATAGHFFVLNRRYEEGIEYYRKALELEPELWSARSQLGINLMRLGQDDEARKQLETCFNNGYQDSADRQLAAR